MNDSLDNFIVTNLKPMRKLIEETGSNITTKTLEYIKMVEDKAYPEEMKMMQEAEEVGDLSEIYDISIPRTTIARNLDWYIIYEETRDYFEIVDLASLPTRDKAASSKEIHDYLVNVINKKAEKSGKQVVISAREDTSYKTIQRMVKNGEYEILEDEEEMWDDDSDIKMHNLVLRPINVKEKENNK